jgi:hypothetical protein
MPYSPSAARRSWGSSWRQAGVPHGVAEGGEDPWLCGPGFRLCRGMVIVEFEPDMRPVNHLL